MNATCPNEQHLEYSWILLAHGFGDGSCISRPNVGAFNRAVASSPAGPAMAGPVLARTFENIIIYCLVITRFVTRVSDKMNVQPPAIETANQPLRFPFPMHEFGKKNVVKRAFKPKWFSQWGWLHYDSAIIEHFVLFALKLVQLRTMTHTIYAVYS